MAGNKHPALLGKSTAEAWPEIIDDIEVAINTAMSIKRVYVQEKTQIFLERTEFFLERGGFVQETYFTWSLVPLLNPTRGFYTPTSEETKQVLSRRRFETLRRISELSIMARNTESFWNGVLSVSIRS